MWAFIVTAFSFLWNGIQAAIVFTVHWLTYMVYFLWNIILATGRLLTRVGQAIWHVTRATYDHVLKPAWQKFDRFVTRVHDWLDLHLGPLLDKVNALRKKLFGFWKRFIRPVLDTIDAVRATLRVLAQLHIPFARQLDAAIGRLEDWITEQFAEVTRRVNELAGWINRIVDLDGLFQRVTLLRSTFKHVEGVWAALLHPKEKPVTAAARDALKLSIKGKTLATVQGELSDFYATGGGALAPIVSESVSQWRQYLRGPVIEADR